MFIEKRSHSFTLFATVVAIGIICAVDIIAAMPITTELGTETSCNGTSEEKCPLENVYNGVKVLIKTIKDQLLGGQKPPDPVVSIRIRVEALMLYALWNVYYWYITISIISV
jgi:hypothetical protein